MELYHLDDIHVFCMRANSFPEDALPAHQRLHALVPYSRERRYFGISRPEPELGGEILYRAAAEELKSGEGTALGCEVFTIPKGTYAGLIVKDFVKHLDDVTAAFNSIIHSSYDIDPNGYCIELYLEDGKDVRCMIRLNPATS